MSDEDALLSAIIANPDEDTPRLVYADWLDENKPDKLPSYASGPSARAEFIRLQIERTKVERGDPRIPALDRQIALLLGWHRNNWGRPLWDLLHTADAKFDRGFIEWIGVKAAGYMRTAASLAKLSPIREVALRNCGNLCELNHYARESRARLIANVRGYHSITLLPQAPIQLEPQLTTGNWLVLAWAIWSESDQGVVQELVRALQTLHWSRSLQFALRPFDVKTEFRTWCPSIPEAGSPVWVRFAAGDFVSYHIGAVPPDP